MWVITYIWSGNRVYKYSMEGKCIKEVGQGVVGGQVTYVYRHQEGVFGPQW